MRSRTARIAAALWLSAAALVGCKESSPEYEQARAEFNAIYAELLEDAYISERIAPVEEKLEQVPEGSDDYARAQELLRRIRSGRERLQAQIAEREEAVRRAAEPVDHTEFAAIEPAEDAGASAQPDAGAPQPVAGMTVAEFRSRFGTCFEPGEQIEVPGRGMLASWALRNMAVCRQRHPGFDQRVLIVEAERILVVADQKDVAKVDVDSGAPAQRDAGAAASDGGNGFADAGA